MSNVDPLDLYAKAHKFSVDNRQVVGEKGEFYITLDQLMRFLEQGMR